MPVRLETPGAGDVLLGTGTADASKLSGTIDVASAGGVSCHGTLTFADPWQGYGVMR